MQLNIRDAKFRHERRSSRLFGLSVPQWLAIDG